MIGTILAAVSVITVLFQQGNHSLSLSCTASQPSMLSGWLTVVYLRVRGSEFNFQFRMQNRVNDAIKTRTLLAS